VSSRDELIAQIRADMERAKASMRADLDRAMFQPNPLYAALPPPKRQPWWRRWSWRVQNYLTTLWWALKGEDLHRDGDCYEDY